MVISLVSLGGEGWILLGIIGALSLTHIAHLIIADKKQDRKELAEREFLRRDEMAKREASKETIEMMRMVRDDYSKS